MLHRILFVDDDQNLLRSYKRQYRRLYQVEIAENAAHALEILKQEPPVSVMVTDFSMPDMDGIELIKRKMEFDTLSVPILITGKADLNMAIRAVNECSIYRFLTKPVEFDEMLPILEGAVEQYKLNIAIADELHKLECPELTVAVCSHCRKVRKVDDDATKQANWKHLEVFFTHNFGIEFSHGLCPDCVEKMYSEVLRKE